MSDTAFPVSRYPIPALTDLPDDIRARILEVQEKAGFVPTSSWRWRTVPTSSARSSPTTTR